jgi:hypothetical protein
VENLRRIADAWLCPSVVVSYYPSSKIVSLNCSSTEAEVVLREFLIDFIEVVAEKDSRGNVTSPGCRLHDHIYSYKEHVEVCPHVWDVTLFREAQLGTVAAIVHRLITCLDPAR